MRWRTFFFQGGHAVAFAIIFFSIVAYSQIVGKFDWLSLPGIWAIALVWTWFFPDLKLAWRLAQQEI